MAEGTASGVPREAFQPGDLAFPQISAPARAPRPLFSPSGNTHCLVDLAHLGLALVKAITPGAGGGRGRARRGLFPVEPVLSAIGYHHSSWLGRSWFGTSSGGRQGLGGKVDAARCL